MHDDKKLDSIKNKIRALLGKTTANNATEEEAIAAANKAAELMGKWDLAISDLEIPHKDQYRANEFKIDPDMDNALIRVGVAIADLCQCSFLCDRLSRTNVSFFGEEQDSEIALYLMTICARAIRHELATAEKDYAFFRKNIRYRKRLGFLEGISHRLAERIESLDTYRRAQTSGALVVSKKAAVDEEMNARYNIGKTFTAREAIADDESRLRGIQSANNVPLNHGLASNQESQSKLDHRG